MEYIYKPEEQIEIVKKIYEAKDAGKGSISDLADKQYNIPRKTFYNYKDYTESLLNKYGFKLRDIYNISLEDLLKMKDGTYKKEEIIQSKSIKEDNKLLGKMYNDFNKVVEIKQQNKDIDMKEPETEIDKIENSKPQKSWVKWVVIASILLIVVVIIFTFVNRHKKLNNEQNNDEIVNTEDSNNSDVSTWQIF